MKAFQTQLNAIKWGRSAPADLSKITQPDRERRQRSDGALGVVRGPAPPHQGIELIIYPDSGHGGIFQFHDKFAPVAVDFLAR